jgi:hypothetical protein
MKSNPETRSCWLQRVEELKGSRLTRKAYCEKHQINISTLDYRREWLEATKSRNTAGHPCEAPKVNGKDPHFMSACGPDKGRTEGKSRHGFARGLLCAEKTK